jgi:cobalamin biosynthesis Mg chelatase CobN
MRSLGRPRTVLVALLVVATGLFAYGVLHERSLIHSGHTERAAQLAHESAATRAAETPAKRASESPATKAAETPAKSASESAATKAPTGHVETAAQLAREGRVLGVDLESTSMIVLAILAGLALAILAASPLGTMRAILLALALGALTWSALDVREIVHQANESRTDLAIVAGFVAALHAVAAALAAWIARRPPDAHPRTIRPPTTGIAPG